MQKIPSLTFDFEVSLLKQRHVQADDGYLYPLERAFFYVHKPPTLIVFDEIDSVEFMRQGGGLVAATVKTFDLNVRQKNDQVIFMTMPACPH